MDLKVIEQRKTLDLLKYERKAKKTKLRDLEKEYEHLLIEDSKSAAEKRKTTNPAKKVVDIKSTVNKRKHSCSAVAMVWST